MRPLEKKKNSYYENIPFCKLLLNFYERKKMFCAFLGSFDISSGLSISQFALIDLLIG